MLKKENRLSTAQFDSYFKKGKRFHFEHSTVIYHDYPTLLCAVVVGKKVSKIAVRRNTIRRRIYSRFTVCQKELSLVGVFIIIIKPSFNVLSRKAADEFVTQSIAATQQKA